MTPNSLRQQEQRTGWLLSLPALILLLLVFAYPIGSAFWSSVFTQNLGTQLEPVFTGLENYARMLADGRFWNAIGNTTVFTVISLTLELILGIIVALVLDQQFRGRGIVRTIGILPYHWYSSLGITHCGDGTGLGMDF